MREILFADGRLAKYNSVGHIDTEFALEGKLYLKRNEVCEKTRESKVVGYMHDPFFPERNTLKFQRKDVHSNPGFILADDYPQVLNFVRACLRAYQGEEWIRVPKEIEDLNYKSGVFLQGDWKDALFVEFWRPDYQPWLDFIEQQIQSKWKV